MIYEAAIEAPHEAEQLARLVEKIRDVAWPRILITIEADDRRDLRRKIDDLALETDTRLHHEDFSRGVPGTLNDAFDAVRSRASIQQPPEYVNWRRNRQGAWEAIGEVKLGNGDTLELPPPDANTGEVFRGRIRRAAPRPGRPIPLTRWQYEELVAYEDGYPKEPRERPGKNLIRRNLLTLVPAYGPGAYRITDLGLAALRDYRHSTTAAPSSTIVTHD